MQNGAILVIYPITSSSSSSDLVVNVCIITDYGIYVNCMRSERFNLGVNRVLFERNFTLENPTIR